jgi:xanthine dehydrogenase YagR molybdenum-binding subunit
MYAHGAVFAEVTVDPELGQVQATRLVGTFAAGTIVNPRLVRSQYQGGMIGITGAAGAVANAVWHATGVRVRRFPITIEQLVGAGAG